MGERVNGATGTADPVAVSPLVAAGTGVVVDGWEVPPPGAAAGEVTIIDLCPWTKVQVRGEDDVQRQLAVPFGRALRRPDRLVVGSGPGEWTVLAAPHRGQELVAELATTAGAASVVVDVTHGRALVRLRGPGTLDVLRRLTAMDLDDRFVPDGAALRTPVAGVVTDVVRDDDGGPSYLLHCERSSGRYLVGTLIAAGHDRGATLVGPVGGWPGG